MMNHGLTISYHSPYSHHNCHIWPVFCWFYSNFLPLISFAACGFPPCSCISLTYRLWWTPLQPPLYVSLLLKVTTNVSVTLSFICSNSHAKCQGGSCRRWCSGQKLPPDIIYNKCFPSWVCTNSVWQLLCQRYDSWETIYPRFMGHSWPGKRCCLLYYCCIQLETPHWRFMAK